MSVKPLAGVKILDLTWVYAGPYCTMLLQDMGADVVKVEAPPVGDLVRFLSPMKNGVSGYFYMVNRGKKSIGLNLKSEAGISLFKEMVKEFDVVVENFIPRTMDRLGIGYDVLKEINPKIIYASISGFGTYGPYSDRPGLDPVAQAMGGLMSLTGWPDTPPVKTGPGVADALAGLYTAFGIEAALLLREKTGIGERIELSMMDAVFSFLEEAVIRTSMTGDPIPGRGNTDPLGGAPWDAFKSRDGHWIMVCAIHAHQFASLYELIGRKDLIEEFGGNSPEQGEKRSRNVLMLNGVFAEYAKNLTGDELMEMVSKYGVPTGPVKTVNELLHDPHLRARNMVIDINHPKLGQVSTFNQPIKMQSVELGIAKGENPLEPDAGEQSDQILKKYLNMSDHDLARLRNAKAIWG